METLESVGITGGMLTSAAITIAVCLVSFIAGRRLQVVPFGTSEFCGMGRRKPV